MKKHQFNKTLIFSITTAFLLGSCLVPALSAGQIEQIQVRNGIRLNLNGEEVTPVDASGKEMPIFLYGSTTYVPVRYLSEQYGKKVEWNPESATVYISDPQEISEDLLPVDPDGSSYNPVI